MFVNHSWQADSYLASIWLFLTINLTGYFLECEWWPQLWRTFFKATLSVTNYLNFNLVLLQRCDIIWFNVDYKAYRLLLWCFWSVFEENGQKASRPPFTFTLWKSFPSVMVCENEWSTCESDTFQFSPSEVHLEEVSAVGSAQLSYASFDPGTPDAHEDSQQHLSEIPGRRSGRCLVWPDAHSFSEKLVICFSTALREKSNNAEKNKIKLVYWSGQTSLMDCKGKGVALK